jgi:hypothetical protein
MALHERARRIGLRYRLAMAARNLARHDRPAFLPAAGALRAVELALSRRSCGTAGHPR